jgi:Holliday junction DNA helicase RuvA
MYEYFKGRLAFQAPTHVVIEVGGIGYFVHISLHTFTLIKGKENVHLYISFQVKEDAHTLYGFAEESERRLFHHLISVSGIGPGTGRMMLSSISPDEIQSAIIQGNVPLIQKIKGIGPKTAQRVILELQDKLKKQGGTTLLEAPPLRSVFEEASSALLMLGFAKPQIDKIIAILTNDGEERNVEQLIKDALKRL